jgi:hypothetical protein
MNWKGSYKGNSLEVKSTNFKGVSFFINGKRQDVLTKTAGMDRLSGMVGSGEEKIEFKARLIPSGFHFNCFAFANGEEVKMEKFKKR